jgi:RNA polymerase primary sigma factor
MNPKRAPEFRTFCDSDHVDRNSEPPVRNSAVRAQARKSPRPRARKRPWITRPAARGRTLASADLSRRLSASEECSLADRIRAGDPDAEEALIVANLGLVKKTANEYKHCGIADDDLIQEGNLGLIRAARHFDPTNHPTRFATYAVYWIRRFMVRAIADNRALLSPLGPPAPPSVPDRDAPSKIAAQPAREPGEGPPDPLATLGILAILPDLRQALAGPKAIWVSLDDLALPGCSPPDEELVKREDHAVLCAAVARLSPFETWVVCERYGLGESARHGLLLALGDGDAEFDDQETAHPVVARSAPELERGSDDEWQSGSTYFHRSFVELGRECGLSVFRLRQVERTALDKLRAAIGVKKGRGDRR